MHAKRLIYLLFSIIFAAAPLVSSAWSENNLSIGYKAYKDGDFEKAAEYLEYAKKDDPLLLDYSSYYLGEAHLSLNKFDDAITAYNDCINSYIKSPFTPSAMDRMGDIYLAKGDIINAIASYKKVLENYPDYAATTDILYKIIFILQSNGMEDEAIPFLKRMLTEFPQEDYPVVPSSLSPLSLNMDEFYLREKTLLKTGDYQKAAGEIEQYLFEGPPWILSMIPDADYVRLNFLRGKAYYYARNYKKAKEIFEDMFSNAGDSKIQEESLIYLARSYIGLRDFESARTILEAFAAIYEKSILKDEALYRLAVIANDERDENLSISLLKRLIAENPLSPFKNEALWQISWMHYTLGNLDDSLSALKLLENSALRMQAVYWQGKINLMLGKKEDAVRLFNIAAESFPPNYYSVMSRKALEKAVDKNHKIPNTFSVNKKQTEKNKEGVEGFSDLPAPAGESLPVKRTQRLLKLGLNSLALKELSFITKNLSCSDPTQNPLYVSVLYREAGDIHRSYILARGRCSSPSNSQKIGLTTAYQLAFPQGYKEMVERAADEFRIDPLLIYAVMMQESEFDEKEISNAGAIGLLQIMPATGGMIAQRLAWQSFKQDDLFLPSANISFGSWYIKTMLTRYKGDLPLAVAAYNAGPNAVDVWLKRWGKLDMDEFIENIPYKETKKYVKKVMGYYEAYKAIYAPPVQNQFSEQSTNNYD